MNIFGNPNPPAATPAANPPAATPAATPAGTTELTWYEKIFGRNTTEKKVELPQAGTVNPIYNKQQTPTTLPQQTQQ